MRPFVRLSPGDGFWYIDLSRDDPTNYPGTSWAGYDSLDEAMDVARAAYIAEPA